MNIDVVIPELPLDVFSVTGKKNTAEAVSFFHHIASQGITNDTIIINCGSVRDALRCSASSSMARSCWKWSHAAGGGMHKLVITNIDADMSTR